MSDNTTTNTVNVKRKADDTETKVTAAGNEHTGHSATVAASALLPPSPLPALKKQRRSVTHSAAAAPDPAAVMTAAATMAAAASAGADHSVAATAGSPATALPTSTGRAGKQSSGDDYDDDEDASDEDAADAAADSSDMPPANTPTLFKRERATVPFNYENWRVLGVWLARRCSPTTLFWLAYCDREGRRLPPTAVEVGVDSVMKVLAPKKKKSKVDAEGGVVRAPPPPTRCLFLHVRVVQRINDKGVGFGELRYICTDLGVSYRLGNTGHYWLKDHPRMFQLSCPNWNSSLSHRELADHLLHGSGKIFHSEAAQSTRRFIRAVLDGKGILAQCVVAREGEAQAQGQGQAATTTNNGANEAMRASSSSGGLATMGAAAAVGVGSAGSGDSAAASGASPSSFPSFPSGPGAVPLPLPLPLPLPPLLNGAVPEQDVPFPPEIEALLARAMDEAVPFAFHPPPAGYGATAVTATKDEADVAATLATQASSTLQAFADISTAAAAGSTSAAGQLVAAPSAASVSSVSGAALPAPPVAVAEGSTPSSSSGLPAQQSGRRRAVDKHKPPSIPDALLPALQFVTVPTPTLPRIVIPRPQLDEGVLLMRALTAPKKGRFRTPAATSTAMLASFMSNAAAAGAGAARLDGVNDAEKAAAASMLEAASAMASVAPTSGEAVPPITLVPNGSVPPATRSLTNPVAQAPALKATLLMDGMSLMGAVASGAPRVPAAAHAQTLPVAPLTISSAPSASTSVPVSSAPPSASLLRSLPQPFGSVVSQSSASPLPHSSGADTPTGARSLVGLSASDRATLCERLLLADSAHRGRADLQPIYIAAIQKHHIDAGGQPLSLAQAQHTLATLNHTQLRERVEQLALTPEQDAVWRASQSERLDIEHRYAALNARGQQP